ncbi:hypothetical protein CM240_2824 [Clostridium bornimense]|uniref:Uncharacterized protein n=1 Tax=Clostridium bornimense TaxID=1216932 RepID=W6RZ85_9CLOT|nr:DUF6179 domain-containing protein [Clostridium bornimense]CDM69941.1 hypothetical protein CM240_2824 [Clostridium bornimense]
MHNSESIEKYNPIIIKKLSKDEFFKDFLEKSYENNLVDHELLQRINYERMKLLREQLTYYTNNESSSVMVEVAEEIMKSIDFTIGFYLKSFDDIGLIIEKLQHDCLEDIFKEGKKFIDIEVIKCKSLFDKVKNNKLNITNYSYDDTIDYGLDVFFKKYDSRFAAHIAPCSVDYQLSIDFMDYIGVEYIKNYLTALYVENTFCSYFDINLIKTLLRSYDDQWESLLLNIFEIVLTNAIALSIVGKDIKGLNVTDMDKEIIISRLQGLSISEIIDIFIFEGNNCCDLLKIEDKNIRLYIKETSIKIGKEVTSKLRNKSLDKIIISFKDIKENIKYIDGKKVSNSIFKAITEEIRDCKNINDKITLIKENFKSIYDLIDMLEAECLFYDEYKMYFETLSDIEIALFMKNAYEDSDKVWIKELKEFLHSLDIEKVMEIERIKDKIQLY